MVPGGGLLAAGYQQLFVKNGDNYAHDEIKSYDMVQVVEGGTLNISGSNEQNRYLTVQTSLTDDWVTSYNDGIINITGNSSTCKSALYLYVDFLNDKGTININQFGAMYVYNGAVLTHNGTLNITGNIEMVSYIELYGKMVCQPDSNLNLGDYGTIYVRNGGTLDLSKMKNFDNYTSTTQDNSGIYCDVGGTIIFPEGVDCSKLKIQGYEYKLEIQDKYIKVTKTFNAGSKLQNTYDITKIASNKDANESGKILAFPQDGLEAKITGDTDINFDVKLVDSTLAINNNKVNGKGTIHIGKGGTVDARGGQLGMRVVNGIGGSVVL